MPSSSDLPYRPCVGIMLFNQDGKVFQKNLGEGTSRIAGSIKEYNPDSSWTEVKDAGVAKAVTEK